MDRFKETFLEEIKLLQELIDNRKRIIQRLTDHSKCVCEAFQDAQFIELCKTFITRQSNFQQMLYKNGGIRKALFDIDYY